MALDVQEREYLGISSSTGRASSPISGVRVTIEYTDERGTRSSRTIRPLRYSRSHDGREFIRSWCETRNAERTFRVDRIVSVGKSESVEEITAHATIANSPRAQHRYSTSNTYPSTNAYRAEKTSGSYSRSNNSKPAAPQSTPSPAKPNVATRKKKPRVGKFMVRAAIAVFIYVLWTEISDNTDPFVIRRPPVTQRIASTVTTQRSTAVNTPADRARISAFISSVLPSTVSGQTSIAGRNSTGNVISTRSTTRQITHRGVSITESTSGIRKIYGVDGFSNGFESIEHARAAVNARVFIQTTGVSDLRVLELYLSADTNVNGYLSWPELESFQRAIDRRFRYTSNSTALRPDEFMSSGGGDCEDWALLTAGLCRFWGWATYIGSIGPETGTGHAVCFVRMNVKPDSRYSFYHFPERTSFHGKTVPAGYYVPVDYERVGGLSSAVEKGWRLRRIYEPESIYGRVM